jgi:dolichol-phosphate mannosyltransferase
MPANSDLNIAVIVPALNEINSIKSILTAIVKVLKDVRYTICVVDAGSKDGTIEVINTMMDTNPNIVLLNQVKKKPGCQRGAGSRMALEWLVKNKSHTVFTEVDSDGAHSVNELRNGMMAVLLQGFDVVIASKYVYGSKVIGRPFFRRMVSYCYSQLARCIFSRKIRDYSNSYRFYSAKAAHYILNMKPTYTSPMYLLEMLATCLANNLKIVEFPSEYIERDAGKSKVTLKDVLSGLVSMFYIGVRNYKADADCAEEASVER